MFNEQNQAAFLHRLARLNLDFTKLTDIKNSVEMASKVMVEQGLDQSALHLTKSSTILEMMLETEIYKKE